MTHFIINNDGIVSGTKCSVLPDKQKINELFFLFHEKHNIINHTWVQRIDLREGQFLYLLLYDGEEIVGIVSVGLYNGTGIHYMLPYNVTISKKSMNEDLNKTLFVMDLIIHTDYHRQGHGTKMLEMVKQYALENGYENIIIECEDESSFCSFYEKNGFNESGVAYYCPYCSDDQDSRGLTVFRNPDKDAGENGIDIYGNNQQEIFDELRHENRSMKCLFCCNTLQKSKTDTAKEYKFSLNANPKSEKNDNEEKDSNNLYTFLVRDLLFVITRSQFDDLKLFRHLYTFFDLQISLDISLDKYDDLLRGCQLLNYNRIKVYNTL
jgi:GNAT superfamily N-acetyltransferase